MKIAIIGSGIAGNVVASKLHPEHDITGFEALSGKKAAQTLAGPRC